MRPFNAFYKARKGDRHGLRSRCKRCTALQAERWRKSNPDKHRQIYRRNNHRHNIRKRFGLTVDQFDALVAKYGDRCAICQQPESRRRRLSLDHCHKTGELRGFICSRDNIVLGLVRDDPALLRRAAEYLESPPMKEES